MPFVLLIPRIASPRRCTGCGEFGGPDPVSLRQNNNPAAHSNRSKRYALLRLLSRLAGRVIESIAQGIEDNPVSSGEILLPSTESNRPRPLRFRCKTGGK